MTYQRGDSGQNQIRKRSGTAGAKAAANWKRQARRPTFMKMRFDEKPSRMPNATHSWKLVTMPPRIDAGETSAL
jgi:hypothetical protein